MTMLFHVIMHGCFGLGIGLLLTYRDGRLQMHPVGYVATSTFPPSLPCVGGQHLPHFGL